MIKQPQSIWYPHPFPTDIMWQDRSSLESDKMLHFAQLAMLFCHLLRQICQRAMKSFGKCSSCNLSSSGWTERATDKVSFAILWLVYLCFFLALQCLGDMGAPQHVKLVAWCSSSLLIYLYTITYILIYLYTYILLLLIYLFTNILIYLYMHCVSCVV